MKDLVSDISSPISDDPPRMLGKQAQNFCFSLAYARRYTKVYLLHVTLRSVLNSTKTGTIERVR
jgi:hypothetical protein